MAGKKINSKAKGSKGELEASKELTRLFGKQCRRTQQYNGLGDGDVTGLDGFHVEVKRTEALRLYKAVEQAKEDAEAGEIPMVLHRKNREEWLAIIPLNELPEASHRLQSVLMNKVAEEIEE